MASYVEQNSGQLLLGMEVGQKVLTGRGRCGRPRYMMAM